MEKKNDGISKAYGESFLLLVIFFGTCCYLVDAYQAEASFENLLLILPVGLAVVCLCAWQLIRIWSSPTPPKCTSRDPGETIRAGEKRVYGTSVAAALLTFGIYVPAISWVGFDVATFGLITIFLPLQGERRMFLVLGFSLVTTILLSLFCTIFASVPMPFSLIIKY